MTLAAGAASVAFLDLARNGYKAAVDQLDALTTASITFNASQAETQTLNRLITRTSNTTAQDYATTAAQAQTMSQLSFTLKQTMELFPIIARAADLIQFQSKGKVGAVEATKDIGQLAHQFGIYDTKGVAEIARLIVGLTKSQPEGLPQVVTQGKYFIPTASALGLSVDETFSLLAQAGVMGFLKSKGGTSIGNTLLGGIAATTVTGHLSKAQAKADSYDHLALMNKGGQSNFFDQKTQAFDMAGMMRSLYREEQRYKANPTTLGGMAGFTKDLAAAFGRGSVPYIIAALRPDSLRQAEIAAKKTQSENINADYLKLQTNDPKYVQQLLGTNWTNLLATTFKPLVQDLLPWFSRLANIIGGINDVLTADPGKAFGISLGIIAVGLTAGGIAAKGFLFPLLGLPSALTNMGAAAVASATEVAAATAEMRAASAGGGGGIIPGYKTLKARPETIATDAETAAMKGRNFVEIGFDAIMAVASAKMLGIGRLLAPVGSWLAPLTDGAAGIGRFALTFGRLLVTVNPVSAGLAAAAGAFALIDAEMRHPVDFGKFFADIQNKIQYKLGPAVVRGFTGMFNSLVSIASPGGPGGGGVIGAFARVLTVIAQMIGTLMNGAATMLADLSNPLEWGHIKGDAGNIGKDFATEWARLRAEQAANDAINRRAQDAYDRTRLHGGRDQNQGHLPDMGRGNQRFHMGGTRAQESYAKANSVTYSPTTNINIAGGTSETNAALTDKIKKVLDARDKQFARDVPRSLRQNGGLATSPHLPQGLTI